MGKSRLTLIGDISFPEDFNEIFTSDGQFLITRILGDDCCFEMSGESMYYSLQELEKKTGDSLYDYKLKIVNAILNRISWGEGYLLHRSFTGRYDTQFRSSNSALRTLLAASDEGFIVDDAIKVIANFHFKYHFKWINGIWFCHDSSELNGNTPFSHVRSRVAGKSMRNTLTLNTHLDSLNTLLLLKKHHKEYLLDFNIDDYLYKGIISINQLLELKSGISFFAKIFQKIDNYFLNRYLDKIATINFISNTIYERIFHSVLFKFLFPTVFFNNGFIARDLSVLNRHVDYLQVNIVDFSRVLNLYKSMVTCGLIKEAILKSDLLIDKLERAIYLIENNASLKTFIFSNELQLAWYAEMYFTISNVDEKYREKAKSLYLDQIYCSNSPFYKLCFD